MAKLWIEESTLKDIADAIRTKKGTTSLIPTPNMKNEILSIESGGGGTVLENGFTVNFHNKDGKLIESHSAELGRDIYAPASYVAQYWTDDNGYMYKFPFTCNEADRVFDLYDTGASTCDLMVYERCGVDKDEYPYVLVDTVTTSATYKPVRAIFFKDYYFSGSYLYYGRASVGNTTGYINTDYASSAKYVTESVKDIITVTKEFVEREDNYSLSTYNSSSYVVGSDYVKYNRGVYTNFDWEYSMGRLDETLYITESEYHPYMLQEKTVTAAGEVVPDDGYYGLRKVIVNI